jgi:SPW repeat
MRLKRWQDSINAVLGLWMMASPSILGFAATGSPATRVAWTLGLAIVVFAGIAVYMPKAWEEALNIILGICLLASPWALGYSDQTRPATNAMVVGLLVTVLAVWAMLMDTAVQKWWHERHLTR